MIQNRPAIRRFAHLDRRLRDEPPPTARQLATELQVSVRTIYRDVDSMRLDLGAPVLYDPVLGGWRYAERTYRLPPFTFSEGEFVSLFLAERTFRQYQGTPYENDLARFFKKIVDLLPQEITVDVTTLDPLYSFRPVSTSLQDIETFRVLAKAVLDHRRLHVTYYTAGRDATTERDIDPYHLANIAGEWYLFAYCHGRRGVRVFRPDRIRKIRPCRDTFDRPEDFSPANHLDGALGVYSDEGKPRRIVLDFDPFAARFIREKIWHSSQKIKELPGGRLRLELRLASFVEVKRFALGWGEHCRVLAPRSLVSQMSLEIDRMRREYR
ncbi:MAG: WYL domain-containing protein [Planctomycetes bacterium]|nr:WYL domain-containing protein [Planctomycetota bacterium]